MTESPRRTDASNTLAGEVNIYEKPTYTVVKFVLQNPTEEPIEVTLRQDIPADVSESHVTFPSDYHGDSWDFQDGRLEFGFEIAAQTTVRTAYGTKGVDIDTLQRLITEATVDIHDASGETIGRVTGIQPQVVESTADSGETSVDASVGEKAEPATDEGTASDSVDGDAGDAEPAQTAATPPGDTSEQTSSADSSSPEDIGDSSPPQDFGDEGEQPDQSISAESIVDTEVEPLSEHTGESSPTTAEGESPPDAASEATENEAGSGSEQERAVETESPTAPSGDSDGGDRSLGSTRDDVRASPGPELGDRAAEESPVNSESDEPESLYSEQEDTDEASESPEPWTEPEEGFSTGGGIAADEEPDSDADSGSTVESWDTLTKEAREEQREMRPPSEAVESPDERDEGDTDFTPADVLGETTAGADAATETADVERSVDDEEPANPAETADLPANRSDYILEDVRGKIDSSSEFDWNPLNRTTETEEEEGSGIIGWVRSIFS